MKFYPITKNYTINIPVEGETKLLQYDDNGVTRKVYVGKEEFPGNNRTGMYHKDGDPLLTVTPSEHSWITVSLGDVDDTNTAAPVMYTSTTNETDTKRSINVTLQGNSNITFNIEQNYIPKLMYMIKDPVISNVSYGDLIECIKINKGAKKMSNESPLTSKKDVSIFNGRSSNTYNNIIIEILPYRNMNVSFGFSQDDTLDKLITLKYTYNIVLDSTFITNKSYNTENGYFSFSTNNQNSWNKKGIGGIGEGVIVDVSSHFQFQGTNLPLIDIYISNMLNYTIINSFDLHIKCVSSTIILENNPIFINSVGINTANTMNPEFIDWPKLQGQMITFENINGGWKPNLEFKLNKLNGYVNSANIPVGTTSPIKYQILISNFNGSGIPAQSNAIPLNLTNSGENIQTSPNILHFTGLPSLLNGHTLSATIYNNYINFWTTRETAEYYYEPDIISILRGITAELPGNTYRFSNTLAAGNNKTITINMIDIDLSIS